MSILRRYGLIGLVGLLGFCCAIPGVASAECRTDSSFGSATHFLVNGLINKPVPEAVFDVPGQHVGDGTLVTTTTVNDRGGNKTLDNYMRLRLRVKNSSAGAMSMVTDSSRGIACTTCASSVTIPFSKIRWTLGTATETRGDQPANGGFNDGQQTWVNVGVNDDSIFNLQFHFLNDEVYPAGTYKGTFVTRGVP